MGRTGGALGPGHAQSPGQGVPSALCVVGFVFMGRVRRDVVLEKHDKSHFFIKFCYSFWFAKTDGVWLGLPP